MLASMSRVAVAKSMEKMARVVQNLCVVTGERSRPAGLLVDISIGNAAEGWPMTCNLISREYEEI